MSHCDSTGLKRLTRRPCCRRYLVYLSLLLGAAFTLFLLKKSVPVDLVPETKQRINLYVVEEHHEVLQHWYQEAMSNNMNRTGNTIIHIDAHSDMAPPDLLPGFPLFRWPKGKKEVFKMMQKNDMFIQAAVSVGLIDHVVWICPSWDTKLKLENGAYRMNLGYTKRTHVGGRYFCECHVNVDKVGSLPECSFMPSDRPETLDEIKMDPDKCQIVKSIVIEIVADHEALKRLESGTWLDRSKPVILDVDEDYFGCESGFDELKEAGVPWSLVDVIDNNLSLLICPRNTEHEERADKMMKRYIKNFIDGCNLFSPQQHCQTVAEALRTRLHSVLSGAWTEDPSMFCSRDFADVLSLVDAAVLPFLQTMTVTQLETVARLGFCMTGSPVSADETPQFSVCHGVNVPNQTIVTLHKPSFDEVTQRMFHLRSMLDFIQSMNVKTMTLCRSVRDGYTPRRVANIVESGLLDYFKSKHAGRRNDFHVIFDGHLLGGQGGWSGRYSYLDKTLLDIL